MVKITSMSAGAIDPIAQTKRVFWRPSTTGTPLKAGDPVCYKQDAVDQKERSTTPVSGHIGGVGTTYAQGAQTYTGRLFNVEEPDLTNIDLFAGIVKSLGPKVGADGDMIEIFKANSGAVVPCNIQAIAAGTVVGRTLLAIKVGTRVLGNPEEDIPNYESTAGTNDTKIVGVAMEVRTTAGKCWVKLDENQFMHQGGQLAYEYQIAAGTVDVTVNRSNIEFKQTSGNTQSLHMRALLSGTGQANQGVYRFDINITGDQTGTVYGTSIQMNIGSATAQTGGGVFAPLRILLHCKTNDPVLTGLGYICMTAFEWSMTDATGVAPLSSPPALRPWFRFMENYAQPTHLLYANGPQEFGGYFSPSGPAMDAQAGAAMIPIRLSGTTYYLVAVLDDGAD